MTVVSDPKVVSWSVSLKQTKRFCLRQHSDTFLVGAFVLLLAKLLIKLFVLPDNSKSA